MADTTRRDFLTTSAAVAAAAAAGRALGQATANAATPAGSFYQTDSSQQMVMACDNDAQYSLSAPESGAVGLAIVTEDETPEPASHFAHCPPPAAMKFCPDAVTVAVANVLVL